MKKKLLTLDDLYQYYVNKNESIKFNAEDEKTQIVVQIPARLTYEKNDADTEGLLPVHLQANHTQTNINGSHIEDDVAEKALPSFYNRPILGYMHQVNGQWEFWGHNIHEDDEGNIEYDEIPIGVIPESCNAKLIYDKEKKKTYVEVDGFIYEEYSHAAEILEREEECSVSVELAIRELSYNAKDRYLDITNYYYQGVTVLGCDDSGREVKPGMEGANIRLADFSAENNSTILDINEKLDSFFEKISNLLSNIGETHDSTKGGNSQVTKFEELLEKYNKTVEDINFEYEGLSDEELETAFAEAFEENSTEDSNDDLDNNSENETEENESKENDADSVSETQSQKETEDVSDEQFEKKYAKTFEISHEDVRSALYMLLETYEESDNDWYYISSVYDNHFNYEGMFTGNIFGQKYIKDGDNISFDGERYSLHAELLTDSEYAELQSMRSNYSSISEKLAKYESEPQKQEILKSESYEKILETEEFIELSNNHFDLSVEEVSKKADEILLSYAKNGKLDFSANNKETKRVGLSSKANIESRYGNLFKK